MGLESYSNKIDLWAGVSLDPPMQPSCRPMCYSIMMPLVNLEALNEAHEHYRVCAPDLSSMYHIYLKRQFWSAAGCIMGELLQHSPLFPGRTEIAMLDKFAELLGSPYSVYKVHAVASKPSHIRYDV